MLIHTDKRLHAPYQSEAATTNEHGRICVGKYCPCLCEATASTPNDPDGRTTDGQSDELTDKRGDRKMHTTHHRTAFEQTVV